MTTDTKKKRVLHFVVYPGLGCAIEPLQALLDGERQIDSSSKHHLCLLVEKGRFPEANEQIQRLGSLISNASLIPWRADSCPIGWWQIRRTIRRTAPDIVHLWSSRVAGPVTLAAHFAGIVPVVFSPDDITTMPPAPGPLRRMLCGEMSATLVDTPLERATCVARGYKPSKTHVVLPKQADTGESSTADDDTFKLCNASSARQTLLERFGLPENARLIGTACPIDRRQQLKDAIWSTDLLKVIRDDVFLLIAGDGPHRQRLLTFRDNVQIRDKVHFLTEEDAAELLYAGVDLWWQTGPGTGSTIRRTLAAMRAGRPVIATDTAVHREIIEPTRTGILFPTGDRAALAQATKQLLESHDQACLIARAGKEEAGRRLDLKSIAENYLRVYEELA